MMRVDFVIVGQGLAGTTLAWQLRRRGKSVLVIDREAGGGSASRVAAGLLTSVTGKRMASSWRWSELRVAAAEFYGNFETVLGTRLLRFRRALRLFIDDAEHDDFRRRSANRLAGL